MAALDNDPAAQEGVAFVEDDGLARGDGALGFFEGDGEGGGFRGLGRFVVICDGGTTFGRRGTFAALRCGDAGRLAWEAGADFGVDFLGGARGGAAYEGEVCGGEGFLHEIGVVADDEGVVWAIYLYDVPDGSVRDVFYAANAQAFALANGVGGKAFVLANGLAVHGFNGAGGEIFFFDVAA